MPTGDRAGKWGPGLGGAPQGILAVQKPIYTCTLGYTRNIPAPGAPGEPWQGPAAAGNRDIASCHPGRRL